MNTAGAALLMLFNNKGEILLQHRPHTVPVLPNHWGFFGGDKEKGEDFIDALKREIFEELEYRVQNPQLFAIGKLPDREGTKQIFVEDYDEKQTLHMNEGQDMRWFSKDQMANLKMADDDHETAQRVLSTYGRKQ